MTTPLVPIDETLDEWGSRLFNLAPAAVPRSPTRTTAAFSSRTGATGSRLTTPQARAAAVRQKLRDLLRRAPQVMVKLARAPKGMRGIVNNLTYISRQGQLDLEDEDGQLISGKEALEDVQAEWEHGGTPIPAQSRARDAFHLVLPMPQGTDPLGVQRAVRDFARREFPIHQYAMVLHTFDTDPDPNPSVHPHVHLTVKAVSFEGTRLNPRKPDLQHWREGFAEALREHGIEATTTSRLHRTTQERWTVRHLRQVETTGKKLDRQKRTTARPGRAEEVMRNYEQVMKTLARSDRGEDRQLAADLVRYLGERGRTQERDRGRPKDRDR